MPVRNVRDDKLMLTTASPVEGVSMPLESVSIALMTQVLRPPFAIGSGGPKKQLAASAHEPGRDASQSVSAVQAAPVFVGPMQLLPGPAPTVQFAGPVPVCTSRLRVEPVPETAKIDEEPSGMRDAGKVVALPPPMYRQPRPRSEIFVVPAVSESISPESGGLGGVDRPGPPQFEVPATFAIVNVGPGGVLVVVVVLLVVVVVVVVVQVGLPKAMCQSAAKS